MTQMNLIQKNKFLLPVFIYLILLTPSFSQFSKETVDIVELPNAGFYPKGSFTMKMNFLNVNQMRFSFYLFPLNNTLLCINTSYIHFTNNKVLLFSPSFNFKYRILDEKINLPAIAFGLSTHSLSTYQYIFEKFSPSIFLVGSKSFMNFIGISNIHFGMNYSFQTSSSKEDGIIFFGISQNFFKSVWIGLEYYKKFIRKGNSIDNLLNFSAEWVVAPNAKIGFVFKDLLNQRNESLIDKYLKIEFGLN
ncbi:hypothetical protein D9V84_09915 [Bacteroidetes/Chlorobi group bacterium Naka2016]|jgi:hypothetical protein|nr:MAG: hypothetical protein D9V84_09915 [Bacteroidetes/Chlorobi group bacterium Naka2016]